jgi:hypothetical protein
VPTPGIPVPPVLSLPAPPPVSVPPSPVSGGASTTINFPVHVPVSPVNLGPVSVGTSSGTGSTSGGVTLTLP